MFHLLCRTLPSEKNGMSRKYLFYIAAAFWGFPGMIITVKGIKAYLTMPSQKLWWLMLITAFVLMSFFIMFRKIVNRYSARIMVQPQTTNFWQAFPLRGWILIVCMSCLGIALKHSRYSGRIYRFLLFRSWPDAHFCSLPIHLKPETNLNSYGIIIGAVI